MFVNLHENCCGGFIVYSSSSDPKNIYINLHGKVQDFGINMNMDVNERHWRFFGCGEGGNHGEGEGDCILHHQCHGRNKKLNKFVNLHGKELDKMSFAFGLQL
jgi:hypothetical protein